MKRHTLPFFRPLTTAFLWLFLVLSSNLVQASIQLPTQLNQSDRREALRIFGFGTSGKLLTDPYPMGGYAGFELGLEVEDLPIEDLGVLGAKLASPQQDLIYPKLSVGKGLYDNLDLFVHFTPYNRAEQLSQFGGLVRWGFYQATFLPLSAALVFNLNSANANNQLTTWVYGVDLVGGMNVNNVALYAGLGFVHANGTFIGGQNGVTDSGNNEKESVTGFHTLAGANVHISDFFFALELDRYTVSVMSAKLGVRF